MRFPGIALALPLIFSCSIDKNPSGGNVDTEEVRPNLPTGISPLSQLSKYSNPALRLSMFQPISTDINRDVVVNQINLGQLSLTMANGSVRPTFCDTMSFQRNAFGAPIAAGADLRSAYLDAGIVVSALSLDTLAPGMPIAFDSSNPTGEDMDLGTPSEQFGGPGQGAGGVSNDRMLGNLLVAAENTVDANGDGLVDVPDDNGAGSVIVFDFAEEKCVSRADLIDVEDAERPARFDLFDGQQQRIATFDAGGLGDNSVEHVVLDVCGVRQMVVELRGSGALHDVTVCNEPEPTTQVNYDIDLNNIVAIDFDLVVDLVNGPQTARLGQSRNSLDPARLVSGGTLGPVPLASNALAPVGTWQQVHVEMMNLEAVAHDGSRMALPGSIVQRIDHVFEVRACGSTHVVADWTIDARIEGDMLGLGIGVSFANAGDRYDSTGCPP